MKKGVNHVAVYRQRAGRAAKYENPFRSGRQNVRMVHRMCICVPIGSMSNPLFRNTKLWAGFFAHFLCAFISSLQFKAVVRMNYIVAC